MAPTGDPGADVKALVDNTISSNEVVIFSKTTCPFCTKVVIFAKQYIICIDLLAKALCELQVKTLFRSLSVKYHSVNLDKLG